MGSVVYKKMERCLESLRRKTDFVPETALVLGSGLGDYADQIDVKAIVDYADIDGFPVSTVSGHAGRYIFGTVGGVPVAAMQGRVHYYEGYAMPDVVLPVRLMGLMGAEKLILTNAAGGVNPDYEPGCLMLIRDHILYGVPNPLIGPNADELGTRFPDMSDVYSGRMRAIAKEAAADLAIPVEEGVYIQFTGPSYETPAEIRMARSMGADAVGMSTACEAIAARHMGLEICGISCITNPAAGMSKGELSHREVQETADRVSGRFTKLVTSLISKF